MMAKIALFHFAIVELESGERTRTRTSTKAASILNLIPTWWWSDVGCKLQLEENFLSVGSLQNSVTQK